MNPVLLVWSVADGNARELALAELELDGVRMRFAAFVRPALAGGEVVGATWNVAGTEASENEAPCLVHGTVHCDPANLAGALDVARRFCEGYIRMLQEIEGIRRQRAAPGLADTLAEILAAKPSKTIREALLDHPDREPGEDLVDFAKRLGFGPSVDSMLDRRIEHVVDGPQRDDDGEVVH